MKAAHSTPHVASILRGAGGGGGTLSGTRASKPVRIVVRLVDKCVADVGRGGVVVRHGCYAGTRNLFSEGHNGRYGRPSISNAGPAHHRLLATGQPPPPMTKENTKVYYPPTLPRSKGDASSSRLLLWFTKPISLPRRLQRR